MEKVSSPVFHCKFVVSVTQFLHNFKVLRENAAEVKCMYLFNFNLNRENPTVNDCFCLNSTQFAFPGGRRGNLTLQHILQFTTGGDEEPILGYKMPPSIIFVHPIKNCFLPSANTCINCLKLPRGSLNIPLPSEEVLHNLYDYAFSNAYFGLP